MGASASRRRQLALGPHGFGQPGVGPPPGGRVGPWRLHRRIGPHSWAATDADGSPVVVRLAVAGGVASDAVDAEAGALLAVAARRLPGLVPLAGICGPKRGGPFVAAVATRAVEGPTVAQLLAGGQRLPWPVTARLLAPVADALAGLHAAGWVHGDVAPANVVASPNGGVLVDLGCARPAADAGATGTPGSVAPEVAAGEPVSLAADTWSLARLAADLTGPGPEAALALRRALATDPGVRPPAAALARLLRDAAGPAPTALSTPAPALPARSAGAPTRTYGPRPPAPAPPPPTRAGGGPFRAAATAAIAAGVAALAAALADAAAR